MARNVRSARRRKGSAVIAEMAVVSLVLFTLMFGLFEYGRVVMVLQLMNNAAREGARVAVVTPSSSTDTTTATNSVVQVVTNYLSGQTQGAQNVNVQVLQADDSGNILNSPWTSTPFGQNLVVTIDLDFPTLFPGANYLPNSGAAANTVHLSAQCMMRSEAN
jgi:Flp pilus assembly protein TadG